MKIWLEVVQSCGCHQYTGLKLDRPFPLYVGKYTFVSDLDATALSTLVEAVRKASNVLSCCLYNDSVRSWRKAFFAYKLRSDSTVERCWVIYSIASDSGDATNWTAEVRLSSMILSGIRESKFSGGAQMCCSQWVYNRQDY